MKMRIVAGVMAVLAGLWTVPSGSRALLRVPRQIRGVCRLSLGPVVSGAAG